MHTKISYIYIYACRKWPRTVDSLLFYEQCVARQITTQEWGKKKKRKRRKNWIRGIIRYADVTQYNNTVHAYTHQKFSLQFLWKPTEGWGSYFWRNNLEHLKFSTFFIPFLKKFRFLNKMPRFEVIHSYPKRERCRELSRANI